jgi:glycosyltransferase involved in cell wall biosynthesis
VYTVKLAEALRGLGHEVHLVSQDRDPGRLAFVDATATWEDGRLRREILREPVRCTVYRPDIGGLLPVYVADRYEGIEARPFEACTDEELEDYVARNVAAVREVAAEAHADVALANHLIMGPLIVARALTGSAVTYAVKVHGSALEYTVKPNPERFLDAAREGLASALAVLVGSRHTAESLWATMQDPSLPGRTRLGPPGVDIDQFVPREREAAIRGLEALTERLQREGEPAAEAQPPAAQAPLAQTGAHAFVRDSFAAGQALAELDPRSDRLVAFVGKLIVSKGIDLLLLAWPLVVAEVPEARLVLVGFGAYRRGVVGLRDALAAGDLEQVREIARQGRALEGGPQAPLSQALAFLDELEGEQAERYLRAAARMSERVVFTGRLEHVELADLLPACEAQVVPSTFPEAFGMVAVEAASCGVLPLSAAHSGLAEVTRVLAGVVPAPAGDWLSFELGPRSVRGIAERLIGWLEAPEELREQTRAALVEITRERYSWQGVARGVLAATQGDLEQLAQPPPE